MLTFHCHKCDEKIDVTDEEVIDGYFTCPVCGCGYDLVIELAYDPEDDNEQIAS